MFDSEGNLWVGDNFTIGWQASDSPLAGQRYQVRLPTASAFPDHHGLYWRRDGGRHLRAAVDAKDNAWFTNLWRQVHHGIRQDRQAADAARRHHVRWQTRSYAGRHRHAQAETFGFSAISRRASSFTFPRGDPAKGRIVCEGRKSAEPCKSFIGTVSPCDRPAGPDLGNQWRRRPRDALSGRRSEQGREIQDRI